MNNIESKSKFIKNGIRATETHGSKRKFRMKQETPTMKIL